MRASVCFLLALNLEHLNFLAHGPVGSVPSGSDTWDQGGPWQPAARCDREANKLQALLLFSEDVPSFQGCEVESLAGQRHHYIPARLGFTENERRRGACWGWGTRLAPCQNFLQLCQEVMKPL